MFLVILLYYITPEFTVLVKRIWVALCSQITRKF